MEDLGVKNYHAEGTIVVIEGPRFSSKAESNMYRMWGGSVVGMTTVPEVNCFLGHAFNKIRLPTGSE